MALFGGKKNSKGNLSPAPPVATATPVTSGGAHKPAAGATPAGAGGTGADVHPLLKCFQRFGPAGK